MAGSGGTSPFSVDLAAPSDRSGWCQTLTAPQNDCWWESSLCPHSLPVWKGIRWKTVRRSQTSWPRKTAFTGSSGKLRVSSGSGDSAAQGSAGTVSCPDHLHSGSRRSCGTWHSEAIDSWTPHISGGLWSETDADVQGGQKQFFQTFL